MSPEPVVASALRIGMLVGGADSMLQVVVLSPEAVVASALQLSAPGAIVHAALQIETLSPVAGVASALQFSLLSPRRQLGLCCPVRRRCRG